MNTREHMKLPEPLWLTGETDPDRSEKRTRFFLSLACHYYSESGRASDLAEAIGMSANAYAVMKTRGKVPPETALALEKALGRDMFPRELFRPDLFEIE